MDSAEFNRLMNQSCSELMKEHGARDGPAGHEMAGEEIAVELMGMGQAAQLLGKPADDTNILIYTYVT